MKVLVVDDEQHIRKIIGDFLKREGYKVLHAVDGMDAIDKVEDNKDIDLILLDVRMPNLSGFEAIDHIKERTDAPVLYLTALDETHDEIHGLNLGADDYITKPFRYDVLMARVKRSLRGREKASTENFNHEGLHVDFEAREVRMDGALIDLTKMEYELLVYLVKNKNLVLERTRILDGVWGYDYYGDPRTVDTHVKTLRSKLGEHASNIKTKRGVGYQFKME